MSMSELTQHEIDEVSGAVTSGQVINYGAAVAAVGGAAYTGLALAAGGPVLWAAAAAYGGVSAGLWLWGAHRDIFG